AVRDLRSVATAIGVERLRQAVDRLLEQQNEDGGWSEYERARGGRLLERLNAAEVFGDIMIGYSYPECTSACVQGLVALAARQPGYRASELANAVRRGAAFLRERQRADGSFYGGWGVCFTYGTWFGVEGLLAAGESPSSRRISAATELMLGKQHPDG